MWTLFKKVGRLRDVILPRKRDKNRNRFGFIVVAEELDGNKLISTLHGKLLGTKRLHLSWAKSQHKPQIFSSEKYKTPSFYKFQEESAMPVIGGDRHTTSPVVKPVIDVKKSLPEDGEHDEKSCDVPSMVNVMDLLPNDDMLELMNHSLFLQTIKPETVSNVTLIVEGLRVKTATVRGLSNRCFLAHFDCPNDFEEVDIDFLQIGFLEVRRATLDDLLPSRRAWLEVRGLPVFGWTEENFKKLLAEIGQVLQCCRMMDDDGNYKSPKFLVETFQADFINMVRKVRINGKLWRVCLVESGMSDINEER